MTLSIGTVQLGKHPVIAVPATDLTADSPLLREAQVVEMRIDLFMGRSESHVTEVLKKTRLAHGRPLIATVRRAEEGGRPGLSDTERERLYEAASPFADAVDIEIESALFDEVVSMSGEQGKTSIGSFHDFERTPPRSRLEGVIRAGKERGAGIVKIAVMINGLQDLRLVTDLTLEHRDQGLIMIGMGERGKVSRFFLPLIGSLITFASADEVTAPGQVPVSELKALLAPFMNS